MKTGTTSIQQSSRCEISFSSLLSNLNLRLHLCCVISIISVSFTSTSLIVSGNRDGRNWMDVTMAMFGKFSISASNVIMPVYTAELFPTVIRNLGVGMSNIPAGIALIIVPFLWETVSILCCKMYDADKNYKMMKERKRYLNFQSSRH